MGEARGICAACADPGPLVAGVAKPRATAAARTRQEGLTEPLTERELAILRLLPAPSSLRELASELFRFTPDALRAHLRAIYRKLGADPREEAVIPRARERGLV